MFRAELKHRELGLNAETSILRSLISSWNRNGSTPSSVTFNSTCPSLKIAQILSRRSQLTSVRAPSSIKYLALGGDRREFQFTELLATASPAPSAASNPSSSSSSHPLAWILVLLCPLSCSRWGLADVPLGLRS